MFVLKSGPPPPSFLSPPSQETPFPVAFCVHGAYTVTAFLFRLLSAHPRALYSRSPWESGPIARKLLTSTSGALLLWGNISGVSSSIHTFIRSLTFSGQGEVNTKIFCTSVKWIKSHWGKLEHHRRTKRRRRGRRESMNFQHQRERGEIAVSVWWWPSLFLGALKKTDMLKPGV